MPTAQSLGRAWPDFCFSISDFAEKNLVPELETHPPVPSNPAWTGRTAPWEGPTGPEAVFRAEITPLGAGWWTHQLPARALYHLTAPTRMVS